MTKIEFIKEKCVFNKPQYKAAEENGFQVRTFITSQVSEEIMQEVLRIPAQCRPGSPVILGHLC